MRNLTILLFTISFASSVFAAGEIHVVEGKHLVLRTDLPSSPAIDELASVFDAAVPLWCERLGIDPQRVADWKMDGCLVGDFEKCRAAGLVDDVPNLRSGYQYGFRLWIREQPSDYYRRHLLLHEGVHGLMAFVFRGLGPPWFCEGTAERLATHDWSDGRLTLIDIPARREAVPMWGRIKLIREAVASRNGKTFDDILRLAPEAYDDPNGYAWSWAFRVFLDSQEPSRGVLKKLTTAVPRGVATPKAKAAFNERFEAMLGEETVRNLAKAWIDFAGRLDYGYDARRSRIDDFTPGTPLGEKTATCTVHADRGWQNSAIRLEAGEHIRIEAAGRFQLDDRPGPWIAEPNGITLKYHDGRPVGMLLATVLTDEQDEYVEAEPGETGTGKAERSVPSGFAFLRPVAVGSARAWTPPRSGTLYFRVNDSPADLENNKGNIKVTVESYPVGDP